MKALTMSHHVLKTAATLIALAGALGSLPLAAAEEGEDALLAKLKDSKHSLADGIAQCEKENGWPSRPSSSWKTAS